MSAAVASVSRSYGALAALALILAALLPAPAALGQDGAGEPRPVETALVPIGIFDEAHGAAISLPSVLDFADLARYQRIFELQKDGHWARADAEIGKLGNRLLLGHIMAQRYLHPHKYRSRYLELKRWLDRFADHPDAKRIYRLAMRRKARSARAPRRPIVRPLPVLAATEIGREFRYESKRRRGAKTARKARRLMRSIRRYAARGWLTKARRVLSWRSSRRLLDPTEMDIARAYLAAGYFFRGSTDEAYRLSAKAVGRAGRHLPMASWIAGLSAYRKGRYAEAAGRFEAMAEIDWLSSWTASAAAFWAARSNLVAARPERVTGWLRKAAVHDRTFYGLLAGRVLGIDRDFDWNLPKLTAGRIDTLTRHPAGRRALALLQLGNHRRAERELVPLTSVRDGALGEALLAVAETSQLPALALRTAAIVVDEAGAPPSGALYPVPQWRPEEGFIVDRAVIYAFMRQESRFNARAKSRAGARGLMQLMPATAGFMARKRFRGRNRALLYDPKLNISIAQRYLRYLIDHDLVNGNMLLLAAAYNGGPGNLAKWRRRAARRNSLDPLLFIESIPARETRNYVERVLANLWIYRSRLGQAAPSLDRLAAGQVPFYKSLDGDGNVVAQNARN